MSLQAAMRERVLSHGLHVASAHGLSAVSMGDLARDLDVPRSGLFTLFSNKERLLLAILDQAANWFTSEVIEAARRKEPGLKRVQALFNNWIAWARSPHLMGGCPFVHASSEAETLDPAIRKRLDEVLEGWRYELRSAVEDAKSKGLRADLDTDQLIFEMFGLYLSHHFWHWSMHDAQAEWRTIKAFDRLMEHASA